MNENDIVGGIALLLIMLVIWFFSTPLGMVLLALLIVAAIAFWAHGSYSTHEPWTVSEPNKFGERQILAQGYMDQGSFVLTREKGPGGNFVYPYILTLNLFDRRHELKSAVAKLVCRTDEDGKFIIGTYRGRDVIINADHWCGSRCRAFGEPNGYDTWLVYPPQSELPFSV